VAKTGSRQEKTMKVYRVFFIDGNWIDLRVEGSLILGGDADKGYFLPKERIQAVVSYENLAEPEGRSKSMTTVPAKD
jgi:hypothetical protein